MHGDYGRLCAVKFGFAFGLIWGLGILLTGWIAWLWGYAMAFVNVISSVYIGYGPTFGGAIIGGIWGFVDFFIFAWLVALVYNCGCGKKGSESAASGTSGV